MADISKITLPSGTTYDIKDAVARQAISAGVSFIKCTNAADTPQGVTWDDDGTTITGTLVASQSTKGSFYLVPATTTAGKDIFEEYITVDDNSSYSWERIGTTDIDLSMLGDLAYSDTASGSYTPAGSVSLSTTQSYQIVKVENQGDVTYTPAGTINVLSAQSSGTSYTPTGSISIHDPGVAGASYTPEGSISAPTISVDSAGSTGTIHNPTKVTVAKTVEAAAPGATAPSNAITYYSVANETLSLYQIGYTTGDSITTSDVTVKTGDASYSASAPTFTGVEKKFAWTGDLKKLSFTGTGKRLVTGNFHIPTSASFSGTAATITVSPDSE